MTALSMKIELVRKRVCNACSSVAAASSVKLLRSVGTKMGTDPTTWSERQQNATSHMQEHQAQPELASLLSNLPSKWTERERAQEEAGSSSSRRTSLSKTATIAGAVVKPFGKVGCSLRGVHVDACCAVHGMAWHTS